MEGRWCSKRRKRRVVDASLLGDALPVGWEVIIALRRKGGRFSPYCRHYISPTGEQFSSCKEVSSYLKSHFGIHDTEVMRDSKGESQQPPRIDVDNHQCDTSKDGNSLLDAPTSNISSTYLPVEHVNDVSVSGIDNLPDVQVCDLYECPTCNLSFDVKHNYLQHLMSTHKRTTKTYKLGSSVGDEEVIVGDGPYKCHKCNLSFDVKDKYLQHKLSTHKSGKKKRRLGSSVADGVIIRDGKYECQFCHKVFEERRRYLGHVGNHVKGSIKTPEEFLLQAKTPGIDRLRAKTGNSKMDALIVIAQSSTQDVLPSALQKEPSCVDGVNLVSMAEISETRKADCDFKKNSSSCVDELDAENCGGEGKALSSLLSPCNKVCQTLNSCPTEMETGKDKGRGKPLSHTQCNKVSSKVSTTDEEINGSLPCLDEPDMEKSTIETNFSSKLYSCNRVRQISTADNTSACFPCNPEFVKEGRDKTSSLSLNTYAQLGLTSMPDLHTKEQAFTSSTMDIEKTSCFDTMMMPGGETCVNADISTGNWEGKSTTTEDEGSANESEGGFGVHFLSYNQKPSDMDVADDIAQFKYMDKHDLEHVQEDDDSNLAIVAGNTNAFGCTAPQTSLNSSSPFHEIFEKAGQNLCSLDPNLENESAFEYMKLDAIEPQMYKYNALGGEDSLIFPDLSMDLERDTRFDMGFKASAGTESALPEEIDSRGVSLTTMVCVWCGLEFTHEAVEIEPQPDSVGFMCPDCRAKISKQFNELESNFSTNLHYP